MPPAASFWRGKRVLLTGHTGFKGSWLTIWLHRLGAEVTGFALAPATEPNLFTEAKVGALCRSHIGDIRDAEALSDLIRVTRPEIVFHLAAQPLVRAGYREPRETFAINVMGTTHVLDALRRVDSARVAVMVTTDKVYRETEPGRAHREDDPLGGHDPYGASKAACELVIAAYRESFLSAQGVAVASARAGNVIGGGDWSEDRVIPDAVRAWQTGRVLHIRMPQAVRPWQHVLEPLAGYLALAEALWERPALAGYYNFGPDAGSAIPVRELVELARQAYGTGEVHYGCGSEGPYESHWLALDTLKARTVLDIEPKWTLRQAVAQTMSWYRAQHDGADAPILCRSDIDDYEALC